MMPPACVGDGAQQPELVRREATPTQGLHHEHAESRPLLRDGHAEKGVVALLTRLRKVFVTRVRERIDDHDGLALLDHESGQSLVHLHGDLADRGTLETGRRPERQDLVFGIEEVERAHLRTHALGDDPDQVVEGLLEPLRVTDDGPDVLEDGEPLPFARTRASGPAVSCRHLSLAHALHSDDRRPFSCSGRSPWEGDRTGTAPSAREGTTAGCSGEDYSPGCPPRTTRKGENREHERAYDRRDRRRRDATQRAESFRKGQVPQNGTTPTLLQARLIQPSV